MYKSSRLFLIAAAILLSTIASAQNSHTTRITASKPTTEESRFYANEFKVTIAEAERRLNIQEMSDTAVSNLRVEFESRLAGLYLEHQPTYKIVVRLTGSKPVAKRSIQTVAGAIPVTFEVGAAATQQELQKAINKHATALTAAIPSLQGIHADDKTGEIVLTIYSSDAEASAYFSEVSKLTKLVGHPIRIKIINAPLQDLAYARGGAPTEVLGAFCTTGFSVKEVATGRTGMLTAGHCDDTPRTYRNHKNPGDAGYITFELPFVTEKRDADQDVQWHTIPLGHKALGEIYGSSSLDNGGTVMFYTRKRSATKKGDIVCHRGAGSGFSCGVIENLNYRIPTPGACNGEACSDTWVSVVGSDLACFGGDSGGPFFRENSAYGIQKAGAFTGSQKGQCALAVYMSVDFISDLGLKVLGTVN